MAAHELTDEFADALLRKIQPGIKWMLSNEQPMQRQPDNSHGGGGGGRGYGASSGSGGGGGRGRGGPHKRKAPGS